MQRRSFLTGLAAGACGVLHAAEDPVRYPHSDLITIDSSFAGFLGNTPIRRVYTNPDMY